MGEESTRGGPPAIHKGGGRAPLPCGPPGGSPMTIFCYMKSFLEKKQKQPFGTKLRRLGSNLELRQSCSAGETSLPEGEIVAIIITNDPLIGRGSIFINIFTSTISSQNLVYLLSNLCLIARDWYL